MGARTVDGAAAGAAPSSDLAPGAEAVEVPFGAVAAPQAGQAAPVSAARRRLRRRRCGRDRIAQWRRRGKADAPTRTVAGEGREGGAEGWAPAGRGRAVAQESGPEGVLRDPTLGASPRRFAQTLKSGKRSKIGFSRFSLASITCGDGRRLGQWGRGFRFLGKVETCNTPDRVRRRETKRITRMGTITLTGEIDTEWAGLTLTKGFNIRLQDCPFLYYYRLNTAFYSSQNLYELDLLISPPLTLPFGCHATTLGHIRHSYT